MPRNSIVHSVRDWIVDHPALFSGLIIYAYYVLSSVNFLIAYFKAGHGRSLGLWDYISQFDALPFMWLLAYTFVQLLVFRERVHEKEKQAINQQRKMDIQATQFRTLQEVAVTLMDKINNPAAVIVMYVRRLAKKIRQSNTQQEIPEGRRMEYTGIVEGRETRHALVSQSQFLGLRGELVESFLALDTRALLVLHQVLEENAPVRAHLAIRQFVALKKTHWHRSASRIPALPCLPAPHPAAVRLDPFRSPWGRCG